MSPADSGEYVCRVLSSSGPLEASVLVSITASTSNSHVPGEDPRMGLERETREGEQQLSWAKGRFCETWRPQASGPRLLPPVSCPPSLSHTRGPGHMVWVLSLSRAWELSSVISVHLGSSVVPPPPPRRALEMSHKELCLFTLLSLMKNSVSLPSTISRSRASSEFPKPGHALPGVRGHLRCILVSVSTSCGCIPTTVAPQTCCGSW